LPVTQLPSHWLPSGEASGFLTTHWEFAHAGQTNRGATTSHLYIYKPGDYLAEIIYFPVE
jgi:hypothetical protein